MLLWIEALWIVEHCWSKCFAQEVEKTALEVGYQFSGVDVPKNETDMYGLHYAEFVLPLVKAVQVLNEKVENLELESQSGKSDNEANSAASKIGSIV